MSKNMDSFLSDLYTDDFLDILNGRNYSHIRELKWFYKRMANKQLNLKIYDVVCILEYSELPEICIWLFRISATTNDDIIRAIGCNSRVFFQHVCETGNIKMSKWVFKLYKKLDVTLGHHSLATTFKEVCGCDNLEIAQWLYSKIGAKLKTDHNLLKKAMFRSIHNDRFEVVVWLENTFGIAEKYVTNRNKSLEWLMDKIGIKI